MDIVTDIIPLIPTIVVPAVMGIYFLIKRNNSKVIETLDIANDIKNLCDDVTEIKNNMKELRNDQKVTGDILNKLLRDADVLKVRVEILEVRMKNGGHRSAA